MRYRGKRGLTTRVFMMLALCGAMVVPMISSARAQSGVIHFYVGAAAGGPVEAYGRILADHMSRTLGQTIIIDVRPGANGNVAGQIVADAPADGLAVWVATQSMIEINPSVYPSLRWSAADFNVLIKGVEAPLVLVANPSVPAKTLPELLAWAKANLGKLSITSYSPGTPGHFLGVQMNEKFGLDFAQVPYKGSAPQITDLLGGYAKLGFTQPAAAIAHIQSGGLRAIATTGEKRFGPLPDVPTFAELGYPDFLATVWYGLVVRAGTPQAVSDRLVAAALAAQADPQVQKALTPLGLDIVGVTGPKLQDQVRAGTAKWAHIVAVSGFKATD